MSFDNSAIKEEIAPILENNVDESPYVELTAYLTTPDIDELPLGRVVRLVEGHTFAQPTPSEPGGRISPVSVRTLIDVEIPVETFTTDIYPYRDGLKLTLMSKKYGFEAGVGFKDEYSRVYKAVLIDETEIALSGNSAEITSRKAQAMLPPRTVTMELIDVAVEQLRGMTFGKPLRNQTKADALKTFLHAFIDNLDVEESNTIRGIDIIDPEDTDVYSTFIVPSFLRPSHVPHYFQRKLYGFYKSGLGSYIYRGLWYIFPKFNLEMFDLRPDALTIVNVPENRYPGIESTYFTIAGKTTILSTGKTTNIDETEIEQLNKGNGIRYGRASNIFYDDHIVAPSAMTTVEVLYDRHVEEFAVTERNDGFNYLRTTDRRITDNDFAQTETLALGAGRYMTIIWENSDPDILYPGVPVRFLYEGEDGVVIKYGVLHGMETVRSRISNMPDERKTTSSTELLIYMER